MHHSYLDHPLRKALIGIALKWEHDYSVLPRTGDALSEFDAAMLVGHTPESFGEVMVGMTAVQKGFDFRIGNIRYQIKHNRPSGKKGSKITNAGKAKGLDQWDKWIWIRYDRIFVIEEAWLWTSEDFWSAFELDEGLTPEKMRQGKSLT